MLPATINKLWCWMQGPASVLISPWIQCHCSGSGQPANYGQWAVYFSSGKCHLMISHCTRFDFLSSSSSSWPCSFLYTLPPTFCDKRQCFCVIICVSLSLTQNLSWVDITYYCHTQSWDGTGLAGPDYHKQNLYGKLHTGCTKDTILYTKIR